jgi:hypothetical protein
MNKYFQVRWIAVALMAAWAIRRWPGAVVAGLRRRFGHLATSHRDLVRDKQHGRYERCPGARRTLDPGQHAEPLRFRTDAFINSPVDLTGRLRVTTYGPYVANLGYNPDQRAADVQAVYCGGNAAAALIMRRYGASYVLSSGGLLDCAQHPPTDFEQSSLFSTAYEADGVAIWQLNGAP